MRRLLQVSSCWQPHSARSYDTFPMGLWGASRNPNNAIEMTLSGHCLVITFNGVPNHWITKPPLPISLMLALMQVIDQHDADVVYGWRRTTGGMSRFKTVTAALFYRLLRKTVEIQLPLGARDFRLMSRRTLDVLNSMPAHRRFICGMVSRLGLRQLPVF